MKGCIIKFIRIYIMKKLFSILTIFALGLSLSACTDEKDNTKEDGSIVVIDDNNNKTTFDEVPTNVAIVGLPPMVSFYLQFVGRVDYLAVIPDGPVVTETTYLTANFDLSGVARTGWMGNYDVEGVLATNPDLVITSSLSSHYETLRSAGINTVGFAWGDDVISEAKVWTERLGLIFDLEEKANAVIEQMESLETLVDSKLKDVKDESINALIMPWYADANGGVEVGSDEYISGYWLKKVGVTNAAKDFGKVYTASMEDIYNMNPDFLFLTVSAYNPSDLYNNTAVEGHDWSPVKAVQDNNVYKFPQGMFSWYSMSIEGSLALLFIADAIYDFDLDLKEYAKEYYEVLGMTLTDDDIDALVDQR